VNKPPSPEQSSQKLTSTQILRQHNSISAIQQTLQKENTIKRTYQEQQKHESVVINQNNKSNSPRIPEHIEFSNVEATSAADQSAHSVTDAEERLLASIKAENLNLLKELLSTGEFKQFLESESRISNLSTIATATNNEDHNKQQARDEDSTNRSTKKYEEEIMKYKHSLEESKRQKKLVEAQCIKKVAVFQRKCNEADMTITLLEKDLAGTQDQICIMQEKEDNLKQSLSTLQRANRYAISEKEKFESGIVNSQDTIEAIEKSKVEMENEKNNAQKENFTLKQKIVELERKDHSHVMQLEKSKKCNLKITQSRVKSDINLKDCKKQLDQQKDREKKLEKEIIELNNIIDNLQKENESLKLEEDRFMLLHSEKDILQGVLDQSTESFESCLNLMQSKVLEEKEKANGLNKENEVLLNAVNEERCNHNETKAKLLNAHEHNTILELEKELCAKEILEQLETNENKSNEIDLLNASKQLAEKELADLIKMHHSKVNALELEKESCAKEILERLENKANEIDLLNASKQLVEKELADLINTHHSKVNEFDLLKQSKEGLLDKAAELQCNFDDLQDKIQLHKDTISNLNGEITSLKVTNGQKDDKILEISVETDAALSISSTEIMDLNDQITFLKVIIEQRDGAIQDHEGTMTGLNDQIASLQTSNQQKDVTVKEIKSKTDAALNVYKSEINKNCEMVNNLALSLTETSKALEMSNKETQRLKKSLVENKKRYRGNSLIKNENATLSTQFNINYLHLINQENKFDFINLTNELKRVIGVQQEQIEILSLELTKTEDVLTTTKESYIEDRHKLKKLFNERENQMIIESMKVGTTMKSQIAQLQSEIDDKVNQLVTAGDNIVFMEDEVVAVKAEFEAQKKISCELQSTLQNMDGEFKDLHNSLQMFEKGLGKEVTCINEEFAIIKEAFSEFNNIISKNDQDVINISNGIEQVKTSYENEKEEKDQIFTELKYELQVANRNLDESTTTKCGLVSKNEELQSSIMSIQKDLKASKLHSKKQQEIIYELKSNFSKIISRFECNLTKSISVGTKTKTTVAKFNVDKKS